MIIWSDTECFIFSWIDIHNSEQKPMEFKSNDHSSNTLFSHKYVLENSMPE